MKLPQKLQRRCGNCRYRVQAEAADRKALYSLCHAAPPIMLQEGAENLLRTWFPIVVETMWCSLFQYHRAVRFLVWSPVIGSVAGVAYWFARHIAWADIAAAIWVP